MMNHKVALGELFKVGSSKRVLKSQWKTEGVPFYRGREVTRLSVDGFVNNKLFYFGTCKIYHNINGLRNFQIFVTDS